VVAEVQAVLVEVTAHLELQILVVAEVVAVLVLQQ
jgi:hypothetical protein